MSPIIIEIDKLQSQSNVLMSTIAKNKDYLHDTSNYLKILTFNKEKVESKLKEIIPHSQRTKRGLYNGIGSIFRSMTENLDSADGERYENLIREHQDNQSKLSNSIKKQNSLTIDLINTFNDTVQQISHNENLDSNIRQIFHIINQTTYRENSTFIKDILIRKHVRNNKFNIARCREFDFIFQTKQFEAIIPRKRYLLRNQLYYTFQNYECLRVSLKFYICKKLHLQEVGKSNPAYKIQMLSVHNITSCNRVRIELTKPIFNRLEDSNQWIVLLPSMETLKFICEEQEEILKLTGTYLIEIPVGCQIICQKEIIANDRISTVPKQPILLPDLSLEVESIPNLNSSLQLEDIKLDELHEIKTQIINNQPDVSFGRISHTPSLWTIAIYLVLFTVLLYICYRKLILPWYIHRRPSQGSRGDIELSDVQLPR
nr:uncharacterized protein LOC111508257 [Leptinotarsa decemlineata]